MKLKLVVASLDEVDEAFRSLYTEKDGSFHLAVDGVEDTSSLKSALQKERQAAKEARDAQKALEERYTGIETQFNSLMSKMDKDGEAKLIAEGKIDEVISRRSEKLRTELQKQVDTAKAEVESQKKRTEKFSQRVLDNNIRAAAAQAGLHKHAIDDALFRARTMFSVDDDGNAIQLDMDGKPVFGKDGKTPYNPMEWLESMKDSAPHWFPASNSGGGAGGNKDTGGNGKTIKRSSFDAMSFDERAAVVKTHTIVD